MHSFAPSWRTVIGVSDAESVLVDSYSVFPPKYWSTCFLHYIFETVERDICKERGEDPSLRGTFLCWHEGFLIYHSCLEPLLYGSGKEWTCSHFFQERRLIDFVKAAGDIGVQHVSWL